ncbi:2-oxoacid:acceptor oxidoreductase subunit alpha [Candidatus Roizmanbacteria bacterium]|nr:2-oxoacid:acceptor oxidoreductase subunit alpha [Candidatus Roizmanbacteria bacterium]
MRATYTFKIGGQAGFGIMTIGLVFSKLCTRSGYQIFDYFEYPSLIRGGHNVTETHFGKDEVFSQERGVNLLVALNRETVDLHTAEMKEGSGVVFDPDDFQAEQTLFGGRNVHLFPVPMKQIIKKLGVLELMKNNIALGAVAGIFGFPFENLAGIIADAFADKGEKIITDNQAVAKEGYTYAQQQNFRLGEPLGGEIGKKDCTVMTGNEAIAIGAIAAGCQFYAAYPMTPSSPILHYLAGKAGETGMVVRHAEDEIAVINEALGASFAGVRSMVGTSGGGFALMNETVSFLGVAEIGLVIIMGQRPGPATGLPTWTEQAELQYVIRAGHGEFPKIVLAPGDIDEAMQLTLKAFDMADMYQTPVIILTDKYIAESHRSIPLTTINSLIANYTPNRGKVESPNPNQSEVLPYPRYRPTEDGISARIYPGIKGYFYQANSYEHIEDGHTTEDATVRKEQVDKRNQKAKTYLTNHFQLPKLYGNPDAATTVVAWGSIRFPIMEAFAAYPELNANLLHFTHMWPMDGAKVAAELAKYKNLVLVENNSTAQLGQLLRQETGILIERKLLKYDGRPIYPEEIMEFIKTNT